MANLSTGQKIDGSDKTL